MTDVPHPRVVIVFELGCGCAVRYTQPIDPEDLQDPLVSVRALASAIGDDEMQTQLSHEGTGHVDRGQETLVVRTKVER